MMMLIAYSTAHADTTHDQCQWRRMRVVRGDRLGGMLTTRTPAISDSWARTALTVACVVT